MILADPAREIAAKLGTAVAVSWGLLLLAGFLYPDQARLFGGPHVSAVLRQITYATPFQPIFLIVALAPIYVAAARNVSWAALASGGLMLLSIVLPFARFHSLDATLTLEPAFVEGIHNSLLQLAGPGNYMPQFVSVAALLIMGGLVAFFWQERVGGLIGLMAMISMAFIWPAVYHSPPMIGEEPVVVFMSPNLLFGYYLAWAGALTGILWSPEGIRNWRLPSWLQAVLPARRRGRPEDA